MRLISWRGAWLLALVPLLMAAPCRGAEPPAPAGKAAAPAVEAASALLVDAETGAVLFARNARQRRAIASTTKIMTAILVLEHGRLDEMATVSEHASQAGQSSVWLQPGERLSLRDLLKGILIRSGNDAAVAAAEYVAGSEQTFVARMNARARELGARDSHFVNPHGLHDPDHYSTAADLALLARHAMRDETFRSIVRSKTDVIANSREPWDRLLTNRNRLLWQMPEADGIKTGFVNESGRCLVCSATREDWRLIGVLLDSPDMFEEARALLEHGFAHFRRIRFAGEGQRVGRVAVRRGSARWVPIVAAGHVSVVVPRASAAEYRSETVLDPPRAPIEQGQELGRMDLLRDGEVIESAPLLAGAAVGRAWWAIALTWLLRAAVALLAAAVVVRTASSISRRRRPPRAGRLRL